MLSRTKIILAKLIKLFEHTLIQILCNIIASE